MHTSKIISHTLDNGLRLVIYPDNTIPKVSTQLWYNVGSKDEKPGQKGLAHYLEHMVFKGTTWLSEVDLTQITQKFSGYCNAFTSQDYTTYLFDFPSNQWHIAFRLFADCMRNCTFKQDCCDSELAAVMQELKLYRDDYESTLGEQMLTAIFADHPYHYPIIGYKQDLWALTRDMMFDFYHQHYIPNNASVIVVGNIDPTDVLQQAQYAFASIEPKYSYVKQRHYYTSNFAAKSIRLYRDIQQSLAVTAFVIPGLSAQQNHVTECLLWILAQGRSSRLYKKLVNDMGLVHDIQAYTDGLFEHDVLFIKFWPQKVADIPTIQAIIAEQLYHIAAQGIHKAELDRAIKQVHIEHVELSQNYQDLAGELGSTLLATGNPQHFFAMPEKLQQVTLAEDICQLIAHNASLPQLHTGSVLPLSEGEKKYFFALQEKIDKEESYAMESRERQTPLEPGVVVHTITAQMPPMVSFPHPQSCILDSGCKVLYTSLPEQSLVSVVLSLKAKHYMDPKDKQGLYNMTLALLLEGTKTYTADQLADALESRGISIEIKSNLIMMEMLNEDLECGLTLLTDILSSPCFDDEAIERVREQIIAGIAEYCDDPFEAIEQVAREQVYKNHPYANYYAGTVESVSRITRADIIDFYTTHLSPQGAIMVIVGDLATYDVPSLVSKTFGAWTGLLLKDYVFPSIQPVKHAVVQQIAQRDQVALCFAGLSLSRVNPNYDTLLLYDQILTGGSHGSMGSRLFQLREQSGLFYTIKGSLLSMFHADNQPSMIMIKTLVSLDQLDQARRFIAQTIVESIDTITPEDIEQARNAIVADLTEHKASTQGIALMLLFMESFNMSPDYIEERVKALSHVTVQDVQAIVRPLVFYDGLITIYIGRIEE